MKIQCWSVGKENDEYIRPGVEQFSKRIANYYPFEWKLLAPAKKAGSLTPAQVREAEARQISERLKEADYLIALDEHGKSFSSPQLAAFLEARANESVRSLIFLIGGAYGLDQTVLKKARGSWSLSALTFPHQLVRLIVAEQLYRACTILRNEKYHHD